MTGMLDRRLNAVRPDLADSRLKDQVDAARYVDGRPARVVVPVADLARRPEQGAPLDTQLLYGEDVRVFDVADGFAWVQAVTDGYVGYVAEGALDAAEESVTHKVSALATFVYPGPDLKLPPLVRLSMGSRLSLTGTTTTRGLSYSALGDGRGFVVSRHVEPADATAADYVAVAETFLRVPYLWAGRSAEGIDCSGLVQLAMAMAGRSVPRDSDQQESAIGVPVDGGGPAPLCRGDLVFWQGHVGIMQDAERLLHANGNTMDVTSEPLSAAIDRIRPIYGEPTSVRRP